MSDYTENFKISLALNSTSVGGHPEAMEVLAPDYTDGILEGETLKVHYKFSLKYMSGCRDRMAAIANLLNDPDVVVESALWEELTEGRAVLLDLLAAIDRIQERQV